MEWGRWFRIREKGHDPGTPEIDIESFNLMFMYPMSSNPNTETLVFGERFMQIEQNEKVGAWVRSNLPSQKQKARGFYSAKGLGRRSLGETKESLLIAPGQSDFLASMAAGGGPSRRSQPPRRHSLSSAK